MTKKIFCLILPFLIILVAFYTYKMFLPSPPKPTHLHLFTTEELSLYNGVQSSKLYLSIVGRVFDVTNGQRHYGPGGSYHFFVAKDATRAFVSGQFTEDQLSSNISDFSFSQINDLQNWVSFYEGKYPELGRLVGFFFDSNGEPTSNYLDYELKLKGSSLKLEKEKEFYLNYPKCNSKWEINHGGEVWCDSETNKSDETNREWRRVPRKYYKNIGSKRYECVCVHFKEAQEKPELFRQYENCISESPSCKY